VAIDFPSAAQVKSSTSKPLAVSDRGSGGRGSRAGRPRRGTGASTTKTCDQPRRREMKAIRGPSGDQRGWETPAGCVATSTSRLPSTSTIRTSSPRT
jgi:hypothetical protein